MATSSSGSAGKSVFLWDRTDPARPRRLGSLLTHTGSTQAIAFSPDGGTLGIAADRTTTLWDVSVPAKPVRRGSVDLGRTDTVESLAFSPDGRTLATGAHKSAILWDVSDPARIRRLGAPLAGQTAPVKKYATGSVESVAFSSDGRMLATGTDAWLRLWDVSDLARPVPRGDVTDPARPVVSGAPLVGHTDMMVSVAYSPDGGILATGSQDKTAMQWRPSGPAAFTRRGPPLTKVATVAFRRDGRALAAGGTVGAISLWDLSDPARPVKRGSPLAGVGARLSQDGRTLAVRGKDDAVTLWDVSDPARAVRRGPPLTGAGVPATFSRNGRLLITADKDQAMLWDLSDPARPVRRGSAFKGMGYSGLLAAFSSDGRTLVIGNFFDFDHKVSLWDVSDPRRPTDRRTPVKAGETAFVASVEFSPDSRILATGRGDGTTVLWDLADPKRPVRLSQPLAGPHAAAGTGVSVLTSTTAIVALAFSADQRTLAVTSQDKSLTLWDLTDASTPRKLGGPPAGLSAAAFSVAFSPDGRALATGGSDGTLTVWDLSGVNDLRAHAAARACAITTRGLDRAEWAHYVTGLPYQRTCA